MATIGDVFTLIGKINITGNAQKDLTNINKQLGDAKSKMDATGEAAGAEGDATGEATTSINSGMLAAGAAATAAGGAIVGALNGCIDSANTYVASVATMQRMTGANATVSSEAAAVMNRYGIEGTKVGMVMKTIATQALTTAQSTKPQTTAFGQMGISVTDANGHLKDQMTLLGEVADYYEHSTNKTQALALASKVLGRGYMALLPVLAGGSKTIGAAVQQAGKDGLILTQQQIKAQEDEAAADAKLGMAWSGLTTQIGLIVMPLKTMVIGLLTKLTQILDGMPGPMKTFIVIGAAIVAALLLIGGPILMLIAVLPALSSGFALLGVTSLAALLPTVGIVLAVLAAIILVGLAVYEVITHWKAISAFFKKLWTDIVDGFKKMGASITKFFTDLWNTIVAAVKEAISVLLAILLVLVLWPLILFEHWKQIVTWAGAIWKDVSNAFGAGIKAVVSFVKAMPTDIWNILVAMGTAQLNFFSNLWRNIKNVVSTGIKDVVTFFKNLPQEIMSALASLGSVVQGAIKGALNTLGQLNPFARHSPSLVDNVISGTQVIAQRYKSLSGMQIGAPVLGAVGASAGAGVAGGGSVTHNYNLTINSSAPTEPMAHDFAMMRSMAVRGN